MDALGTEWRRTGGDGCGDCVECEGAYEDKSEVNHDEGFVQGVDGSELLQV
jgi:hypothetical protein